MARKKTPPEYGLSPCTAVSTELASTQRSGESRSDPQRKSNTYWSHNCGLPVKLHPITKVSLCPAKISRLICEHSHFEIL